jgi:hypothetical protein
VGQVAYRAPFFVDATVMPRWRAAGAEIERGDTIQYPSMMFYMQHVDSIKRCRRSGAERLLSATSPATIAAAIR